MIKIVPLITIIACIFVGKLRLSGDEIIVKRAEVKALVGNFKVTISDKVSGSLIIHSKGEKNIRTVLTIRVESHSTKIILRENEYVKECLRNEEGLSLLHIMSLRKYGGYFSRLVGFTVKEQNRNGFECLFYNVITREDLETIADYEVSVHTITKGKPDMKTDGFHAHYHILDKVDQRIDNHRSVFLPVTSDSASTLTQLQKYIKTLNANDE